MAEDEASETNPGSASGIVEVLDPRGDRTLVAGEQEKINSRVLASSCLLLFLLISTGQEATDIAASWGLVWLLSHGIRAGEPTLWPSMSRDSHAGVPDLWARGKLIYGAPISRASLGTVRGPYAVDARVVVAIKLKGRAGP
jgi:hypothetical protein